MNRIMNNDGTVDYEQNPMKVEEFVFCIGLINQVAEQDYDGTLGSVDRTLRLSKVLLNDPASFWDQWALEMGDGMREAAIAFVQQPGFKGNLEDLKQFTRESF